MPNSDLTVGLVWELVSKTAIVVALLYGVLWFGKKLSSRAGAAPGGAGIQVVQSVHLGPGRSVHLLVVGGRTLLVGSTSHQVSFLSDLGMVDDQPQQQAGGSPSFDGYLMQASQTLRSLPTRLRHPRGGNETGD
jgi:flagellar biosynthetic protein FliO